MKRMSKPTVRIPLELHGSTPAITTFRRSEPEKMSKSEARLNEKEKEIKGKLDEMKREIVLQKIVDVEKGTESAGLDIRDVYERVS